MRILEINLDKKFAEVRAKKFVVVETTEKKFVNTSSNFLSELISNNSTWLYEYSGKSKPTSYRGGKFLSFGHAIFALVLSYHSFKLIHVKY